MMRRREFYPYLRKMAYEILEDNNIFEYDKFKLAQNFFQPDSIECKIAYLVISDQMMFLDKLLLNKAREVLLKNPKAIFLDVGCGHGILLNLLAKEGLYNPDSFFCIENSNGNSALFNRLRNRLIVNCDMMKGHIIDVDINNSKDLMGIKTKYDFVYAMGLLPMLSNPKTVIDHLKYLTNKGGEIFFDFYEPEGCSELITKERIQNIDLGAIWIACSKKYKASYKEKDNGVVEFSLNKIFLSLARDKPRNILRNTPFAATIHKIANKFLWHPIYYWYPNEFIYNILLKDDELEILEFAKSKMSSKRVFLVRKK
jgi:2-polyprenyl-3-methyl-5-hydroxy-6-metoxy-1,4-benzoquinol methylase